MMNMNTSNRRSCWTLSSCFTCVLLLAILSPLASAQWPGWGGPNRNFTVDVKGLSTQWSTDGPKQVWSRDLGPGYSAIAVDQGRLYTMYRKGKKEVVVALDAETGKTVWEHQYDAFLLKDMDPQFGEGPNATPLVHDGRVYTLGIAGRLECVDQKTGKRIWSSGLVQKLKATVPEFGFSSSPIAYKDTLIVSAGGKNAGVAAFDLKTGKLRWRKHDFVDTYSSPLVINVDGEDQLVLLVDREVVGLDPTTGDLKWRFPHENQWKTNISMPVWGDDGLLYVTSGGTAGSRALKLTRSADVTSVEEVWTNKKVKIGQGNVIRIGDQVYGSGGGSGPAFISSLNAKTGELNWQKRGFAKAMILHADGKLIILDENGKLGIATATPDDLTIHCEFDLLTKPAWTVPTLVGKRLYVRDKVKIIALDLG
ncbi:MAG: PQQ-like beta-propeller repeat protein [Planctomycetes bacterium]|nr:PQQ-like beta-propeller repeat protein [Planctomycetota bacterium]